MQAQGLKLKDHMCIAIIIWMQTIVLRLLVVKGEIRGLSIITIRARNHKNSQDYLTISTLVEWSPNSHQNSIKLPMYREYTLLYTGGDNITRHQSSSKEIANTNLVQMQLVLY